MSVTEVARLAGVSVGTVSGVINNRPVSAKRRRAVLDAMARLGYTPPPPDQRPGPKVRPGRARRAGDEPLTMLLASASLAGFADQPVYANLLHGIEREADADDRKLILRAVPDLADLEREVALVKASGLILFGPEGGAYSHRLRDWLRGLPVVSVMRPSVHHDWCDRVTYDDAAVGRLAARYLLDHGCTRLAIVGEPGGAPWDRSLAFTAAARQAGAQIEHLAPWPVDEQGRWASPTEWASHTEADLRRRWTQPDFPDGLFMVDDRTAAAMYPRLLRMGFEPGRDARVVTCNNDRPHLVGLHPRPAVIDIHAEAIGRRAVKQLIWRLEHPTEPHSAEFVVPTLAAEHAA